MAPRKAQKRQQTSDHEEGNESDYRKRRDRNNEAVKKSRFKSKQRAKETTERIDKLKEENAQLEDKVQAKTNELTILKELFLANCGASGNPDVNLEQLLADDDDEL